MNRMSVRYECVPPRITDSPWVLIEYHQVTKMTMISAAIVHTHCTVEPVVKNCLNAEAFDPSRSVRSRLTCLSVG